MSDICLWSKEKNVRYCAIGIPSNAEIVLHEVFCKHVSVFDVSTLLTLFLELNFVASSEMRLFFIATSEEVLK